MVSCSFSIECASCEWTLARPLESFWATSSSHGTTTTRRPRRVFGLHNLATDKRRNTAHVLIASADAPESVKMRLADGIMGQ